MDIDAKQRELRALLDRAEELERQLAPLAGQWPPRGYYTAYHVLAGFSLGIVGAATSLLFNVIGSVAVGQHPLKLIQIYLTFPLGEQALQIEQGLALAIGCCLYLGTGMVLGIPFHLVLTRWYPKSSFPVRFAVVTLLGLLLWIINFYGILSWLQPLVVGLPADYAEVGGWKSLILRFTPWWIAAATHLVFGWTMLLVQPWGAFREPS